MRDLLGRPDHGTMVWTLLHAVVAEVSRNCGLPSWLSRVYPQNFMAYIRHVRSTFRA